MKLICGIERFGFGLTSTLSRFYVEDDDAGVIIEDPRRKSKVWGETCIPCGTFPLGLRTEGDMHKDYLRKFGGGWHKGMLWLRDVPNFTAVYIHIGNKPGETKGCPLINTSARMTADYEWVGDASEKAYVAVYPRIAEAILYGDGAEVVVYERRPQ